MAFTVTREVRSPVLVCSACKEEILPTDWTIINEEWDRPDYSNILRMEFWGGYGAFIDPYIEGGEIKAVLCHKCAHELCEQHPWIADLLRPEHSHAHHRWEYPELIPAGHKGWDIQGGDGFNGHTADEDFSAEIAYHEEAMKKWQEVNDR